MSKTTQKRPIKISKSANAQRLGGGGPIRLAGFWPKPGGTAF